MNKIINMNTTINTNKENNLSLNKLPTELEREILSYLIPEPKNIEFFDSFFGNCEIYHGSYSLKYKIAIDKNTNNKIKNKKGQFLSKISKKNGKHRYYITNKIKMIDPDETEYDEYGPIYHYNYKYISNYVGKNIIHALIELFTG